jgi:hypothetical protein
MRLHEQLLIGQREASLRVTILFFALPLRRRWAAISPGGQIVEAFSLATVQRTIAEYPDVDS